MSFTSDARNRSRKHMAISLVETIVVVAIVGLLIALILPAMQSVRGHSRRTQCRENLRQLGLAMHNYHDSHTVFPPGIIAQGVGDPKHSMCEYAAVSSTCDDPTFTRVSALTLILPYMEETGIYRSYNMSLACCAKENATATSQTVNAYVCPSNPRHLNRVSLPYYMGNSAPAPTDYVLSMGGVGQFDCSDPFAINTGGPWVHFPGIMRRALGPFNVNRVANLDRFKDGTSNTILMGESAGGQDLYAGLARSSTVEGAQRMDAASTTLFCDNPWSMGYIGSRSGAAGFGSVFAATAWNAWYDMQGNLTNPANGVNWFAYPINEGKLKFNRPTWTQGSRPVSDKTGLNGIALPSSAGSAQGFRSYHPNMANFLLGDGSVRSFTDHTDAKILVAYSSIVGKEPVDPSE